MSSDDRDEEDPLQSLIAKILDKENRGDGIDRQTFFAEHPEHVESLRDFFATHDRIRSAAEADPATLPRQSIELGSEDATLPPRYYDYPTIPPTGSNGENCTLGPTEADSNAKEPAVGGRVRYFGDYGLIEEISRGGMGVVFKARQINLNRIVALKMILAGQFAGQDDVQRFYTEAEAAAQLDHPGIVPIFEIGEHQGQHYFSMGFIEGGSLAQRIADGPLPPREAAELVREVCGAMAYAHDRGVIHRDLKPANILIDPSGQPKVTDFGLAKKTEADSNLTGTGQILGTPAYMPPEQASGKTDEVGPLADVYSLGATLYCLLTGRPPFQAANAIDTLLQVLESEPVPPRRLNSAIPVDLEKICLKCLAKRPHQRYLTADDLAADLRRFLAGEPVTARSITRIARVYRWCRRNPAVASLAAAVALVLIAGITVSTTFAVIASQRLRMIDDKNRELTTMNSSLEVARNDAQRQTARAEEGFGAARESVATYFSQVSQDPRLKAEGLTGLRTDLMQEALQYYENFVDQYEENPGLLLEWAQAKYRLGVIYHELTDVAKSGEAFRDSLEILDRLRETSPDDAAVAIEAVRCRLSLAQLHQDTHDFAAAFKLLQDALAADFSVSDETLLPEYAILRCRGLRLLGRYDEALDVAEELQSLTGNSHTAQETLAVSKLEKAEALIRATEIPLSLSGESAVFQLSSPDRDKLEEAKRLLLQALQLYKPLAQEDVLAYDFQLAECHRNLGVVSYPLGSETEAEVHFLESYDLYEQRMLRHPEIAAVKLPVAIVAQELALFYAATDRTNNAIETFRKSQGHAIELVKYYPENPQFRLLLAEVLKNQGSHLFMKGISRDEAKRVLTEALTISQELIEVNEGNRLYQELQSQIYAELGALYHHAKNPELALQYAKQALRSAKEAAGSADLPIAPNQRVRSRLTIRASSPELLVAYYTLRRFAAKTLDPMEIAAAVAEGDVGKVNVLVSEYLRQSEDPATAHYALGLAIAEQLDPGQMVGSPTQSRMHQAIFHWEEAERHGYFTPPRVSEFAESDLASRWSAVPAFQRLRGRLTPRQFPLPGLLSADIRADVTRTQLALQHPLEEVRLAVSDPQSRRLAIAYGNQVRVYSVPEFELVRVVGAHNAEITAIAWNHSGQLVATGDRRGELRIWNLSGENPVVLPEAHSQAIFSLAWNPAGTLLASGGHWHDDTAALWTQEGAEVMRVRHGSLVEHIGWHPNGRSFITGGANSMFRQWNIEDGRLLQEGKHPASISTVEYSPDGEWLAVTGGNGGADKTIRVWNAANWKEVQVLEGHRATVNDLAWSPDSRRIISAGQDCWVQLWDPIEGKPLRLLGRHEAGRSVSVTNSTWSPDGSWIVTTGRDGCRLWNPDGDPGPQLASALYYALDYPLDTGHSGAVVIASAHRDRIQLWSAETRTSLGHIAGPSEITHLARSRDEQELAAASMDGKVRVYSIADQSLLRVIDGPSEIHGLAWGMNGRLAVCGDDGTLSLGGTEDGAERQTLNLQVQPRTMTLSPNGDRLALITSKNKLIVLETESGQSFAELENAYSAAWSGDGKWLAVGSRKRVLLLSTSDYREETALLGGNGPIRSLTFRPGDKMLAGTDGTSILRWSTNGQPWPAIHTGGRIAHVCWTGNGEKLSATDGEGILRVWNATTLQEDFLAMVLSSREPVLFDGAGQPLSGDPEALHKNFVYLRQQKPGAIEIVPVDPLVKDDN